MNIQQILQKNVANIKSFKIREPKHSPNVQQLITKNTQPPAIEGVVWKKTKTDTVNKTTTYEKVK